MFCEKCGQKLDDDAKFCDKCGAPVESVQAPQPQQSEAPAQAPKPAGHGKEFLKKHGKVLGISAAVLVIVIGLLVFFMTRPVTVKLNDYISVEYEGCDTVGSARYVFDSYQFRKDYKDKFEFKEPDEDGYSHLAFGLAYSSMDPCDALQQACVDGRLDKDEDLKNGEEIQFIWECDDERAMKYFHVKLDYENIPFKVEGLEQAEKVNPLDQLEIEYKGVSPFLRVNWDRYTMPDYASYLELEVSPRENLKNGDTVTVTITNADSADLKTRLLERYGYMLGETTKTFTVEGMPAFMTEISQLDEASAEALKKQTEDIYTSYAAKNWETGSVDALEYQGMYLLTQKGEQLRSAFNRLFVIYQITASEPIPTEAPTEAPTEVPTETVSEETAGEDAAEATDETTAEELTEAPTEAPAEESTEAPTEEPKTREEVTYYMGVYFDNLIAQPDGTVKVDLSDGEILYNNISFEGEPFKYLHYRGYKTVEDLVKDCVTSNTDHYTYTTTME